MSDSSAGYSGVVYSDVPVGYTSAEGYTAVVNSRIVTGYSGTAPVTTIPSGGDDQTPPPDRAYRSELDIIGFADQPYDKSVNRSKAAPGAGAATDYRRPVSPERPDDTAGAETGAQADAPGSTKPPPALSAPTLVSADAGDTGPAWSLKADQQFAESYLRLDQTVRTSPGFGRNSALDRTRSMLPRDFESTLLPPTSGSTISNPSPPPARPQPRELFGAALARQADEQLERLLAENPTQSLGAAWLLGLVQVGMSTIWSLEALAFDLVTDETTSIAVLGSVLDQIDARMNRNSEDVWEAANHVLNPIRRLVDLAPAANELAGEALEAARRGDWRTAQAFSRASARAALGFGLEAGATVMLAADAAALAASFGRIMEQRRPRTFPAVPELELPGPKAPHDVHRHDVPPDPRMRSGIDHSGLTGSVTYTAPSLPPPPAPQNLYHPAFPDVPVPPPAQAKVMRDLARVRSAETLTEARTRLLSEPSGPARQRIYAASTKAWHSAKEVQSALESQVLHPERSYLVDGKVAGIRLDDGTLIEPAQIPGMVAADRKNPGRTYDKLELFAQPGFQPSQQAGSAASGRKVVPWELKTENAIKESWYKRGGTLQTQYRASSPAGKELRKDAALTAAARQLGGRIELNCATVTGERIVIHMTPDEMQPPILSDYSKFRN